MSAETLAKRHGININNILVEDLQDRVCGPFDPKDHMTPTEWNDLINQVRGEATLFKIASQRDDHIQSNFYDPEFFIGIATLFPDEVDHYSADEELRLALVKEYTKSNDPTLQAQGAAAIMFLFPQNQEEILSRRVRDDITSGIHVKGFELFTENLYGIKLILPTAQSTDYIPESDRNVIKGYLMRDLQEEKYSIESMRRLANWKIIDPDLIRDVGIGSREWKILFRQFETVLARRMEKTFWADSIISTILYISILAADKVEVGEKGISLSMPNDFDLKKDPPIPEARQF